MNESIMKLFKTMLLYKNNEKNELNVLFDILEEIIINMKDIH